MLPLLVEFLRSVVHEGPRPKAYGLRAVSGLSLRPSALGLRPTSFDYIVQYFARCGVTAAIVASPRGAGSASRGLSLAGVSSSSASMVARSESASPFRSQPPSVTTTSRPPQHAFAIDAIAAVRRPKQLA